MPNPKYTWSSENPKVATVDNVGGVRALSVGQTRLTVRYENINEAKALINVVEPAKLGLRIYPDIDKTQELSSSSGSWYLISNTRYRLEIEVFDANDHKLHTTEVIILLWIFDREFSSLTNTLLSTAHAFFYRYSWRVLPYWAIKQQQGFIFAVFCKRRKRWDKGWAFFNQGELW